MVLKRKHTACIDPKKAKAPSKPQTKADMADEMKLIKQLNDALLEEIKSNEEKIAKLEKSEKRNLESIKFLEKNHEDMEFHKSAKLFESKETQTLTDKDESVLICCNLCIYIATCEEELNWHLCEEHERDAQLYFGQDFPCDVCGKWCESEDEQAMHEQQHIAKLDQTTFKCKFCDNQFSRVAKTLCSS